MLWLVHLLGMNLLANLERGALEGCVLAEGPSSGQLSVQKRFASLSASSSGVATVTAMIALAAWVFLAPGLAILKRFTERRPLAATIAMNQSNSLILPPRCRQPNCAFRESCQAKIGRAWRFTINNECRNRPRC